MNYLFFIPSWSYRGGERIFINFAKHLKKDGNKVIVICGRKDERNALGSDQIEVVYSKTLNKILLNDLFFFIFSWLVMLILALRVNRKINEVVTESNQCLWAGALFSLIRKTKLTWYVMAYEEKHFENNFLNFLYEISFGFVERLCVKRVNTFYALAPRVARSLENRYQVRAEVLLPVIEKINVEIGKVRNDLKEIVKGQKILFLPAALHWKKNQSLAIRLLTKAHNYNLVLAGEGKDEEKLRKLSKKLGVSDRVYFVGVLDRNNMAFMYENSSLTLVCSLNENEGLSLTALESLSYGTPVLVSSRAGVAEIINGRKNVYIANPTISGFRKSLKKIYNN